MNLNFYDKDDYPDQVQVFATCPGCGLDNLAMFTKRTSYVHNRVEYYVGCNSCGWHGPTSEDPNQAARLWDTRAACHE